VEPDQPCIRRDEEHEGERRSTAHTWRIQLAHALGTDGDCAGREAAEVYRRQYPDVDVSYVTCAPSRKQYRWRSRWSDKWKRWWANEHEAEAAFQAEQGCGCTSFGDDETPAAEALAIEMPGPIALGPVSQPRASTLSSIRHSVIG
jgi:hypothetical protein